MINYSLSNRFNHVFRHHHRYIATTANISDTNCQELSVETESYRGNIDEYNKVFYEMKKRKDQLQSERK